MLADSLELFRLTRVRTLALAEELSQEQLDYSPGRGRWSVGEILDHLLLSDEFYRTQIAELIRLSHMGQRPFLARDLREFNVSLGFVPKTALPLLELPLVFTNLLMPRSVREFLFRRRVVPAEAANQTWPRRSRSAVELVGDLYQSFTNTTELFAKNASLNYDNMWLQHPLLGLNNVPQLLRLLALHESRHQDQIADVLKESGFPRVTRSPHLLRH